MNQVIGTINDHNHDRISTCTQSLNTYLLKCSHHQNSRGPTIRLIIASLNGNDSLIDEFDYVSLNGIESLSDEARKLLVVMGMSPLSMRFILDLFGYCDSPR